MEDLCNINHCDQDTCRINENLSRSTLKPPLAGDSLGLTWYILWREKVRGSESKRFKQTQAERRRENKVSAAAKSWHKEWSAVRIRQATPSGLQTHEDKQREISALTEMKFWHFSLLLNAIQMNTGAIKLYTWTSFIPGIKGNLTCIHNICQSDYASC